MSGRVRDAFIRRGHEAVSCDLLPSESDFGPHVQDDVFSLLKGGREDMHWDLMIAFPPCTYLSNAGARWWSERAREQKDALNFVRLLMDSRIEKIAN